MRSRRKKSETMATALLKYSYGLPLAFCDLESKTKIEVEGRWGSNTLDEMLRSMEEGECKKRREVSDRNCCEALVSSVINSVFANDLCQRCEKKSSSKRAKNIATNADDRKKEGKKSHLRRRRYKVMPDKLLYKTELCEKFEANGSCPYGEKCLFAHGKSELRRKPREKQRQNLLCKNYMMTGKCPYGKRCLFRHETV